MSDIRFKVEPRLIPPSKAARRLHITPDEFLMLTPKFAAHGFPSPCPVTGNYDLVAIDEWIGRMSGAVGADTITDEEFQRRLDSLK